MYTNKLHPGSKFPRVHAQLLSGEVVDIAKPTGSADWKLVLVYRGRHCPMCTKYLNAFEHYLEAFASIKVDCMAVSGDSRAQLEQHMEKLSVSFPIAYGLTLEQMQQLGLYISVPRSEKETDHNFAEPALFVINQNDEIQVVDLSNNPFVRPDIAELVSGLTWIRNPKNDYPIRGLYR